jgi:hypothetical protein
MAFCKSPSKRETGSVKKEKCCSEAAFKTFAHILAELFSFFSPLNIAAGFCAIKNSYSLFSADNLAFVFQKTTPNNIG